jgi:hypothetical protein
VGSLPYHCLPARIGEICFYRKLPVNTHIFCHTRFVGSSSNDHFVTDITVYSADGHILETLTGVEFNAFQDKSEVLVRPATQLTLIDTLQSELQHRFSQVPLVLEVVRHSDLAGRHEFPEVTPTEIERIDHDISPSRRQATLASLIAARRATVTFAYRAHQLQILPEQVILTHRSDGKPQLDFQFDSKVPGFAGIDITLTDSTGISLALVGPTPIGIDLELIESRDAETWKGLLGQDGYLLARRLASETMESFDMVATRVWALLEAGGKTGFFERILPQYIKAQEASWQSFFYTSEYRKFEFLCTVVESANNNVQASVFAVCVGVE